MTSPSTSPAFDRRLALAVRIGTESHAIPIGAIEEVLPALPIESIPGCPRFVRGVVFVRGQLIPVLSGAERLSLTDAPLVTEPHIVCLRVGGRLLGIEVDEALDLIDLARGVRLTAREAGAREGFFSEVVELDGIIFRLLNPDQLLARDETAALNEVPHIA